MGTIESGEALEELEEAVVLELAAGLVNGDDKASTELLTYVHTTKDLRLPHGSEARRYRQIQGILGDYARRDKVERPMCFAVFGPPGSGKSFGVKQLLRDVGGYAEPITLNLSQLPGPESLADAFKVLPHVPKDRTKKADYATNDAIPVIFFDEFDTSLDGAPLGWLRWFLAPMQDSEFFHRDASVPIGRALFVFAGGTAESLEDFQEQAREDEPLARARKVPDFLSRLRGFIDVQGINAGDRAQIVRRALLLDHFLGRIAPKGGPRLRVDRGLLESLLKRVHFVHGVRSLEATLDMSQLSSATGLAEGNLPDMDLRGLHLSHGPLDGCVVGICTGRDEKDSGLFEHLGQNLLKRGASIAYGGDLVDKGTLHKLISAAESLPKHLLESKEKRIRNYLGFPSFLNPGLPARTAQVLEHVEFLDLPSLSPEEKRGLEVPEEDYFPVVPDHPRRHFAWALSLFRMRARMIGDVDVVIVVGGNNGRSWGRFSGIAEEVMLALAMRKPVIVMGGAHGASEHVGKLLGLGPSQVSPDECLSWHEMDRVEELVRENSARFQVPGLPRLPLDVRDVRAFLHERGIGTDAWTWNGLTIRENRDLFQMDILGKDHGRSVDLITRGLSRLDRGSRRGKGPDEKALRIPGLGAIPALLLKGLDATTPRQG